MPKATSGADPLAGPKDPANVEYLDVPMTYKGPLGAVADQVIVTCNETDSYLFKVRYVQCRRPELGDKFSSRHGQKGVIGMIYRQVGTVMIVNSKASKVSTSTFRRTCPSTASAWCPT